MKNKITIIFSFLLLCIFIAYLILIKINLLGSDSTAYINAASAMVNNNVFSSMGDLHQPDNFRTIGYPLVIAFVMLVTENYIPLVIAMQVFLLALMFLIFTNIGALFKIEHSPILFVPFMLHPELLNLATSLQTEFLYIFFLFLFFLYTLKFIQNKKDINLIFSTIFLALSLHIKPVYLFFIFIYLIFIYVFDKRFKSLFLAILTLFIVIAPWVVRNKITLDTYSFTSSKNFNLLCYAYSIVKEKDNLSDIEAVKSVDNMIIKKYDLLENESILNLVSAQNNELINNIIPMETKEIIYENISYLLSAYFKGVLRGFYLPHTIYNVDRSDPVHIGSFIEKIKQKKIISILIQNDKINYSVIFFYVFPYVLNLVVLIGLVTFSFLFVKDSKFRTYETTFLFLFVWYGIAVAFPWSNNSRYMMAYFPQMALMFIYTMNFLSKRYQERGN